MVLNTIYDFCFICKWNMTTFWWGKISILFSEITYRMFLTRLYKVLCFIWARRDRTVVGFTITSAISTYHHWSCELNPVYDEVYSIPHYVIKFVNDLRQVGGFLRVFRFPPPIKLIAISNWNIVESDVKHHKPKPVFYLSIRNQLTSLSVTTLGHSIFHSIWGNWIVT